MIAQKGREGKRAKALKMAKLFKEKKCRECSVVVTRMDFAKILGKFTKVKIQYESSSPKSQNDTQPAVAKSNGRLRNNENGMVQLHKSKRKETPKNQVYKPKVVKNKEVAVTKRQSNNILKENNVVKKVYPSKLKNANSNKLINSNNKQYVIIFSDPQNNNNTELKCELSLKDLLPKVDNSILPSSDWCIDFFPKPEDLGDDKVYDRIAAELEDLMRSEQPQIETPRVQTTESKMDEFPSIMDILNDNTNISTTEQKNRNTTSEFKATLDSSDVEAMLLGKTNDQLETMPIEVDHLEVNKLVKNNVDLNSNIDKNEEVKKTDMKLPEISKPNDIMNPSSPSILEDVIKPSVEEKPTSIEINADHISKNLSSVEDQNIDKKEACNNSNYDAKKDSNTHSKSISEQHSYFQLPLSKLQDISYLTFQKVVNGTCLKAVKYPKNLKYTIELDQKSVELIGAPKYISTLEDLQVLLQIVNESELSSPYVLHSK